MNKKLLLGAAAAGIAALLIRKQNGRKKPLGKNLDARNPGSRHSTGDSHFTAVTGTGNQPWEAASESRK